MKTQAQTQKGKSAGKTRCQVGVWSMEYALAWLGMAWRGNSEATGSVGVSCQFGQLANSTSNA